MVGAINPNSTQTLDAQIRAAAKADFEVAPGESVPNEASPTPDKHSSSRLSSAAIIGIVFGGIAFIALCAGVLFYMARRRATRTAPKDSITPTPYSIVSPVSPEGAGYPPPFSPCSNITPYFYSDRVPTFPQYQQPPYVSVTQGVANETHANRQPGLTLRSHRRARLTVTLQSSKRQSTDYDTVHTPRTGEALRLEAAQSKQGQPMFRLSCMVAELLVAWK